MQYQNRPLLTGVIWSRQGPVPPAALSSVQKAGWQSQNLACLLSQPVFLADFLDQVYGAAEALFAQLAEELKRWADWVVLGTIQDLDEYADSNLTEVGVPSTCSLPAPALVIYFSPLALLP